MQQLEPLLGWLEDFSVTACVGIERPWRNPSLCVKAAISRGVEFRQFGGRIASRDLSSALAYSAQVFRVTQSIRRSMGVGQSECIRRSLSSVPWHVSALRRLFRGVHPRILLTCAFEVDWRADLVRQLAQMSNARVVNIMNGLKHASPKNCDAIFDMWFLWSEAQRQMLVEDLGLRASQFVVTGHLGADSALRHRPGTTLNSVRERWPNHKMIAVFSQPDLTGHGYRYGFHRCVLKLAREMSNAVCIVKPHPSEDYSELERVFSGAARILVVKHDIEQPRAQLFDILAAADVSMVMFSTVALESLFMKTPVLAVNLTRESSPLPFAGKTIWTEEAKNSESIVPAIDRLLRVHPIQSDDLREFTGLVDGMCGARVAKAMRTLLAPNDKRTNEGGETPGRVPSAFQLR